MGFFSDLKEDLSQAVNELMPEDEQTREDGFGDINEMLERVDSIVASEAEQDSRVLEQPPAESSAPVNGVGKVNEDITMESTEKISEEVKEIPTEKRLEAELATALEEPAKTGTPKTDYDLEKMLESALAANDRSAAPVYEEEETDIIKENQKETKGNLKWQS